MNFIARRVGAVLVAVLALGLVPASISAAAQFTASSYPASLEKTGLKGTSTFKTEGGTADCKGSASGTLSEASNTLKLDNITATECSAFGFANATVSINGCYSLIYVTTKKSGDAYTGPADLVCPVGKTMVTTASTCEVLVGPQTGSATLEYVNVTAEGYVEAKVISSNVTYTVAKDGFLCPFGGTGVKTKGEIVQHEWTKVKLSGVTASVSG